MSTITAAECASNYSLFGEYYDTGATTTQEEFDATPYARRWLDVAECFAANAIGTDDESRAAAELEEARAAQ